MIYADFEKSISWAASEIFDNTDQCLWTPILEMASKIRLNETCKTYECLLEFHHDDRLAIDVSFGVLSSTVISLGEFMPSWWDLYVDRCDQIDPAKIWPETINANNSRLKFRKRITSFSCALPDYHYLEFDCSENSICLGGIFQRLDRLDAIAHPKMLNEILDYCLAFRDEPNRTTECQQMLKDVFESLGCPNWIGLMIGRGDMVKLIFKSPSSYENIQPSFWQWFSTDFRISCQNAIKYLSLLDCVTIHICIDLCLSAPSTHPRLCFEIFPINHLKESKSWSTLNSLIRLFSLNEDLIFQIQNLYNNLPRGVKKTPFSHIYSSPQLPFNTIAAFFSHYKICLEKEKPLKLKTYVDIKSNL